jgi:hypothetical protein
MISKHPYIDRLALCAGGELSFPFRHLVDWHLSRCANCVQEVELFSQVSRESALEIEQLLQSIHWDRLSAEMHANIRRGLEASETTIGADRTHSEVASAQPSSRRMAGIRIIVKIHPERLWLEARSYIVALCIAALCAVYWFSA